MEAISREWQGLLFVCLCVSVETKRERKKGQLSEANTREAGVADACHQNNFLDKGTKREQIEIMSSSSRMMLTKMMMMTNQSCFALVMG